MTRLAAVLGRGLVDADQPGLHLDDLGLTRGDGCFEGLRVHPGSAGPVVAHLDAHLARMARSAAGLDLPFDHGPWSELVGAVVAAWAAREPEGEAALKLVLTRGREGRATPTGFATMSPLPAGVLDARRRGVDVAVLARGTAADAYEGAPWLLGGVKLLSYAVNMAGQREARRRGADDALFVAAGGELLESPTSSVVWGSGDTLTTVAPGPTGILASITTEVMLDAAPGAGLAGVRGRGSVADLHAADVVMLVSSVRGVVRVRSLDGVALPVTDRGREVLGVARRLTGFDDAA